MKHPIILCALAIIIAFCAGCSNISCQSRDLAYEHYCDSIWTANPDYYVDVLAETDQYQDYIQKNGTWWPED